MSEFIVTIGEEKKEVIFNQNSHISINGRLFEFELSPINNHTFLLKMNSKFLLVSAEKLNSEKYSVYLNGKNIEVIVRSELQEKAIAILEQSQKGKTHKTEVKSPMPGMILKINKSAGDTVASGESVIILEAMKMENNIHSPAAGIIKNISVKEGNPVEKGAVLFSIE
ncbi:MAG: biotin/lipoyl-containing protein [Ignavibacteriaceae bacterium]